MKNLRIFSVLLFFIPGLLTGQDFHLSQYEEAALNLNPAMTGMFGGKYRLHSHYRTQWGSIATKPFVTCALSGEMNFKKISAGAEIINQRAGAGGYNVFGILVSGAYDKALGKSRNHRLSVGLQAGLVHKSVNLAKLLFETQYVTTNGGGFNNSLPNNEFNFDQGVLMHDVNLGLVWYYAKSPSRFNPFVGITVFHLSQAKESFFANSNVLPMRYVAHGGCKVILSERFQLMPKAMYMRQVNAQELTAGMDVHYYLKDADAYVILGGTIRNMDAVIPMFALKYGSYTYRISYDINTSSLQPHTRGRGGFEFSVTMLGLTKRPEPVLDCPRQ